jgi:hypothetical protein
MDGFSELGNAQIVARVPQDLWAARHERFDAARRIRGTLSHNPARAAPHVSC